MAYFGSRGTVSPSLEMDFFHIYTLFLYCPSCS
ncbi:hypothetical protein T09_3164 [Trichinella sp. T9]|nr:hypothetical protein T09_3164 [Trichinella sp. T9]